MPADEHGLAARRLHASAATIGLSVLADSTLEHYRGGLYRPAMYVAPAVALLTTASGIAGSRRRGGTSSRAGTFSYAAASGAGLLGFGYHVFNVSRREGGWNWTNVFYGAPVAAPLALHMAGVLGLFGAALQDPGSRIRVLLGAHASRIVGGLTMLGLLGTSAETGLLHFRGAFQDPYMYLPVSIPPAAAVTLGAAILTGRFRRISPALLATTAVLGFAGVGFHAYGVHRNMGGWRNWSQNVLQGPPLPAPPSFTGLALAGFAALALRRGEEAA